jgi:hypothetical protein
LTFEQGDFVAQQQNSFVALLDVQLLGIDNGQQRYDQRRPFAFRDWGQLKFHTLQNRNQNPAQLRLSADLLRSYGACALTSTWPRATRLPAG